MDKFTIEIVYVDDIKYGKFISTSNKYVIYINKNLSIFEKVITFFHEITHFVNLFFIGMGNLNITDSEVADKIEKKTSDIYRRYLWSKK